MASGTFKPNSAGFREMAIGSEIRAAVGAVTDKAKAAAVGMAQDFRVTGDYADSFEVSASTVELRTSFGSHPVAAGLLTNTSDHAAAVEWGNEHDHRAHHVLARTLDTLTRLRASDGTLTGDAASPGVFQDGAHPDA